MALPHGATEAHTFDGPGNVGHEVNGNGLLVGFLAFRQVWETPNLTMPCPCRPMSPYGGNDTMIQLCVYEYVSFYFGENEHLK